MKRDLRVLAAAGSLVLAFSIGDVAFAQKQGGTGLPSGVQCGWWRAASRAV
jgi:hypothetical protein